MKKSSWLRALNIAVVITIVAMLFRPGQVVLAAPFPSITSINPTSGSTLGGTSVIITGTDFDSGATVTIGGASATSVVVVSDTSITAVTPAGTAGAKDVVVTQNSLTGTLAGAFTYATPTPVPTSISPTSGSTLECGYYQDRPGGKRDSNCLP